MQPFHWTGEMTSFQPEIDAEHRELLRLCDELHRAVEAHTDGAAIQEITRQLAAEADAHFSHEERLMRSRRLAGYAWHKRQHDYARRSLQTLAQSAPGELAAFLANWVRDHVGVADRIMAARLRNAELAPGSRDHALTATKKVRPSPRDPSIPRSSAS